MAKLVHRVVLLIVCEESLYSFPLGLPKFTLCTVVIVPLSSSFITICGPLFPSVATLTGLRWTAADFLCVFLVAEEVEQCFKYVLAICT